ncbi:hypothetical protein CPJCM30710_31790 [Clostridium polyendosporum]|uniref:Uncharacterized protein n=1 Tax=Clostridium polyendosporum TaxID=69208 RepID=A0A919VNG2_9CLOT|nr:hypothetical protein [Clostridium polyendosporum]GIM30513.1 hypothetical protein CPJCM30710_31790 [Clostridium polyendosporum]
MNNEWIMRVTKNIILVFLIAVIVILLISANLYGRGLSGASIGQGWYMIFQYYKKNDSFVVAFGYMVLAISIMIGIIADLIGDLIKIRKGKVR